MWWAYTQGAYIWGGGLIVGGLRYIHCKLEYIAIVNVLISIILNVHISYKQLYCKH